MLWVDSVQKHRDPVAKNLSAKGNGGMMRVTSLVFVGLMLVLQPALAQAQNNGPPPNSGTNAAPNGGEPSAEPEGGQGGETGAPEAGGGVETGSKWQSCREEGRGKGLRGWDLVDYAQICAAQARLDCIKDAVAKKIRGPGRKDYIKTCMGTK